MEQKIHCANCGHELQINGKEAKCIICGENYEVVDNGNKVRMTNDKRE